MLKIDFMYRDEYTRGEWHTQSCVVESVAECKRIYGLDTDPTCEYQFIKIEVIK